MSKVLCPIAFTVCIGVEKRGLPAVCSRCLPCVRCETQERCAERPSRSGGGVCSDEINLKSVQCSDGATPCGDDALAGVVASLHRIAPVNEVVMALTHAFAGGANG